jgi:membrane-bound serine protease (ClpP class)
MKKRVFWIFLVSFFLLSSLIKASAQETYVIKDMLQININSAIGPATYEYLKSALHQLPPLNAALLIKMSTPGGLVSTTKQILNLMGESHVPVIIWIAPQGSSATSAGAIISAGAHFIFMSQGTNIGAATPIGLGGDLAPKKNESQNDTGDVRAKAVNDLVALTKSLAQSKGRNASAFESMITNATSFSAKDALANHVIDGIADDEKQIWSQLDSKEIQIQNKKYKISCLHPTITNFEPNLGQQLLLFFANPEMAYILFLTAIALFYFEFQAPGGYVAGAFGIICLIFAGIGFQLLTVNLGGILFLALALSFFVVEIYLPSFGLLSLAGMAALIAGSLILYKTDDSLMALDHSIIAAAVIPLILTMGLMAFLFFKTRTKKNISNFFTVLNNHGPIVGILTPEGDDYFYQVKVDGQIWRSHGKLALEHGDIVEVKPSDSSKLTLEIVKKI